MTREQVTSRGNCYVYKYYLMDYEDGDRYEVDIYRENGITGERIFQTNSYADSLKGLFRIIGQWEHYYKEL